MGERNFPLWVKFRFNDRLQGKMFCLGGNQFILDLPVCWWIMVHLTLKARGLELFCNGTVSILHFVKRCANW